MAVRHLDGAKIRALAVLALYAPGATTLRPKLHRMRGVSIGDGVSIGQDALIETVTAGTGPDRQSRLDRHPRHDHRPHARIRRGRHNSG